jgi:hypothetical protein
MQELAGLDIDEEIIDSIVGEDETLSISKAQKLASKFNSVIEVQKLKHNKNLQMLMLSLTFQMLTLTRV